jgi:pimeloyl-ACP methyl ester carboxylesterase
MDILHAMLAVDFDKVSSREEVEEIVAEKVRSERIRMFIMKNLFRIGRQRFAWRMNVSSIYTNIEHVFVAVESPYVFEKPALFVRGGASPYVREDDYPAILEKFPAATFSAIEVASHWVHADKPDELCSAFSNFLKKTCEFNP